MKIILLQDIPKLGRKNEVKEVSDGFARNFLFPQKLAKPATDEAVKEIMRQKERKEREYSEEFQKTNELVDKLKSLELHFKVKMGEKGRAFGSVTPAKIRDELAKHGISVKKEVIQLEDSIKTTGEHIVKIKFPFDLEGEVKVIVESE